MFLLEQLKIDRLRILLTVYANRTSVTYRVTYSSSIDPELGRAEPENSVNEVTV